MENHTAAFVWAGGGTERLGIHPVNLVGMVPGYVIVVVGLAITAVAVALRYFK